MGLKDLVRKPISVEEPSVDTDDAAEAFISGAPVTTTGVLPRRRKRTKPTFVRTTFSLSKDINKQIDKISLYPRTFRVSRSDVVRAGVMALMAIDKAELLQLLEKVSGSDPVTEIMQDE